MTSKPRNRLGSSVRRSSGALKRSNALGESFALSLEQVVSSLGALELTLHSSKRLPRGEDGFPLT